MVGWRGSCLAGLCTEGAEQAGRAGLWLPRHSCLWALGLLRAGGGSPLSWLSPACPQEASPAPPLCAHLPGEGASIPGGAAGVLGAQWTMAAPCGSEGWARGSHVHSEVPQSAHRRMCPTVTLGVLPRSPGRLVTRVGADDSCGSFLGRHQRLSGQREAERPPRALRAPPVWIGGTPKSPSLLVDTACCAVLRASLRKRSLRVSLWPHLGSHPRGWGRSPSTGPQAALCPSLCSSWSGAGTYAGSPSPRSQVRGGAEGLRPLGPASPGHPEQVTAPLWQVDHCHFRPFP